MPFSFGEVASNAGDMAAVQCMLTKGDMPIDITWMHNGDILTSTASGISVVKMSQRLSSLSIESVSGEHRGIYTCIAKNTAGFSNYSAELSVNGIFVLTRYQLC